MMIVALAWIYVVAMMSIAETSIMAGIMTFFFYCVLPLTIILYVMDAPRRRRNINRADAQRQNSIDNDDSCNSTDSDADSGSDSD
jgi:hypothetical protein